MPNKVQISRLERCGRSSLERRKPATFAALPISTMFENLNDKLERAFKVLKGQGPSAPLGELDYCASCGQIGCAHDGRDRGAA